MQVGFPHLIVLFLQQLNVYEIFCSGDIFIQKRLTMYHLQMGQMKTLYKCITLYI